MDNMVLQKVWQQGQRLTVDDLSGCAFTGENAAHTFEISGKNASGAVAISGTIAGKFLRSDNVAVPVTGTASDGVASITLTEDCYAVPGRFIFSVYANDGTHNICIYCGVGNVLRTDSGEYEGGEIITDVTALINAIETAVATIPADYSTLLAAIAPTFSASTAYTAGSYVWYDGTLYRFTADHAAGSWTGTDAAAANLGGDLADLKSAFDDATQYATNYIEGYYVARDGTIVADADCCVSELIPIAAMSPRSCAFYYGVNNGTKINLVIYDENEVLIDYWGGTSGEARSVANIPTTAKYARMSFKRGYQGKLVSSNGFVYWGANGINVLTTATAGYTPKNRNNFNNGAMGTTPIYLEQNAIKNLSIVFYGKIGSFSSLKLGVGANAAYTEYIEIDSTNITFYVGTSAGSAIPHGLTIAEYLSVIINIKPNCDYTIIINTLGGIYTRDMVYPNPWIGNKGAIFAQAGSADTFTTYRFTYNADFNKTKWLFGDSYITNYSDARWPYYMQNWGYDNTLLNGYPGENSNDAFQDFLALIQHGSPKYVVWCMGMNDPDTSAINADWLRCVQGVISICQRRGIEPILATIPNVPNILHTYKNAWIKNDSGCRYIDFAEAVGAESANSTWYTGCLEEGTSRVHPTVDGARLLAVRALTDFPEFMQK